MTTDPPEPIMDHDEPLEPNTGIRRWIKDVWPSKGKSTRRETSAALTLLS